MISICVLYGRMRANEIITVSGYTGWEISGHAKSQLMSIFPPRFSEVIGHHITHEFGVRSDAELPSEDAEIHVVGYACDENGLEALVVSIDGSTERPDGKTYHITWSLDRDAGFKPVQSNSLIADGWNSLNPINITATARFFKS